MKNDPVTIPLVNGKIVVYRAKDGWRWHTLATNGQVVADSGEAYRFRWRAVKAATRFSRT
jgi:uncharacterized protein YegP (UPF0339 family)